MTTRSGAISRRRLLASASAAGAATLLGTPVSESRGGPAAHHPRHPVGRRLGRRRGGMGARRPPRAHAGRGCDQRQLSQHHPHGACRCAAGERLHRQGAARRTAGRTGHLLPGGVRGPFRAAQRRPAGRPFPHAGRALATSRSSGRATPAADGASTSRAAACAPTRPCCATGRISSSIAATTSMPNARSARSRSSRTARSGATS